MTQSRRKVCIFATAHGGIRTFSVDLGRALKQLDWDVRIVIPRPEGPNESDSVELLRQACNSIRLLPFGNLDPPRIDQMAEEFHRFEPDVLIPNCRRSTYAAAALVRRRAVAPRIVGVCHNDDDSYYNMLSRFASIIELFVCPTEVMVPRLARHVGSRADRIQLIPHAVHCSDEPIPAFGGGPIRIVYHGAIRDEHKQSHYLIDVAERLKSQGVPFRLVIVGNGPHKPVIEADAADKNLGDVVEFRGEITQRDKLIDLLSSCHLAILTSEFEAFCYSLAEAMGLGLPAVAFECGGVIESYLHDNHNGFVVPQGDVDAMVGRIAELQNDPGRWKTFSREAHRTIRSQYGYAAFRKAYGDALAALIDSKDRVRRWPRLRPVMVDDGLLGRLAERVWRHLLAPPSAS